MKLSDRPVTIMNNCLCLGGINSHNVTFAPNSLYHSVRQYISYDDQGAIVSLVPLRDYGCISEPRRS
jgi:hypothetical protein